MSVRANPPFSLFTDRNGDPLNSGYIYIGTANQDPVTNPIPVFSDAALTVSVAQPIRTSGGAPVVNGTEVNLYVGGNYSIMVKDRNNTLVYSLASAALAGGDITLAAGETLLAESGSTIDMKSGSTLNLGGADGAGVAVVVAAPTRITGDLVPNATGRTLGLLTNLWDAFMRAVVVTVSVLPSVAGVPVIGSLTLPFANVIARRMQARDIETYSTTQPASTAALVKRTQHDCLLASCVQSSAAAAPAAGEVQVGYNIASITHPSTGIYVINFTRELGTTGVRSAHATGRDGGVTCNVNCGLASALVDCRDAGNTLVDAAFNFSVRGSPEVADPIT